MLGFAEILTENGAPVRLVLDSSTTVDPITCGAKEALVPAMNRGVCVVDCILRLGAKTPKCIGHRNGGARRTCL